MQKHVKHGIYILVIVKATVYFNPVDLNVRLELE